MVKETADLHAVCVGSNLSQLALRWAASQVVEGRELKALTLVLRCLPVLWLRYSLFLGGSEDPNTGSCDTGDN